MEKAHRIVSSEAEELILVDSDDNETGFLSKAECHDGQGQRHRAFSLFLFNEDGELLLQQRAASKRLWPGYWSNTCCSHPRRGETLEVATRRRLRDELNIEWGQLQIEQSTWSTHARIEQVATEDLALVRPEATEIYVIERP